MNTATILRMLLTPLVMLSLASGVAGEDAKEESKQKELPADGKLFDGKTLDGWKILAINDFDKHGKVSVVDGAIVLDTGRPATGISYQGKLPRINYEISLDAKRVDGDDFFCGLTFPVGKEYCSLIIGGWGGGVTGLSNLDNMSAVENETTGYQEFKNDQWYKIRLRVTEKQIQAWVDEDEIVDVATKDRKFSIWWEQEPVRPLGVASWHTKAALRNITLTPIKAEPEKPKEE